MSLDIEMLSNASMKKSAEKVLQLLSEFIGVDTLFIAINDGELNLILKALHRQEPLVIEGTLMQFAQSYCQLVGTNGDDVFVTSSTLYHPATADLNITTRIGNASFFGAAIRNQDGRVVGTICGLDRHSEVLESRQLELLKTMASFFSYVIELEQTAYLDKLTGSFNRNYAMNYLESNESTKYEKAAFIFIDIDNFKKINDTYGHRVGDEVLIEVTARVQRRARNTDILCRLGGDEFLYIIWDYGSREVITRIISDIMNSISRPFQTAGGVFNISVSAGVSLYPEHGDTFEEILHSADEAMYSVKRSGKNNYRIYKPEL